VLDHSEEDMLHTVRARLRTRQTPAPDEGNEREAGFTLIELMVVLLIIAILLAIAIPTFLGVTSSANDRAAQSNLTNGLTEATAQFQSAGQTFTGISSLLNASAPEYSWSTAGCSVSSPNCISVAPYDVATSTDQQGVVLAAMAKTGTCWYVAQLQATPAVVATTGFEPVAYNATHAPGMELQGLSSTTPPYSPTNTTALVAAAGTYYAKKVGASTAQCSAAFPEATSGTDSSAGFVWGPSFSSPGVD